MNAKKSSILCATDFSPHANEAATVAAKIALRRGEKLRLIHITHSPRASVLTTLRSRLDSELDRLQKSGFEAEALLLNGSRPADELVAYIRREPASLVVVGCGVKSPMDRWARGSFSEQIAESSPVPTLVVRNPAVFDSWDWSKGRLRVLLALDFYSSSDVVLRWAKQFQIAGPCDFVACHVNWRMPSPDEYAEAAGVPVNPPTIQRRLERDLKKKIRDQMGDDSVELVVRPYFGDVGPPIVELAAEKKAQLIVVGAHQRHGIRRLAQFSVSREVLHQSSTNVICVPITASFDPREAHLPEFRRVLVATDFSELGNSAIPVSCAACSIGGLVRIVHVVPASKRRAGGNHEEQLRALIPNETGARCRPPEVGVLENDDVAKAICVEAETFGADVVCMASHGVGVSRALHGSVTRAVLKRLRRPLLIIRRPDE